MPAAKFAAPPAGPGVEEAVIGIGKSSLKITSRAPPGKGGDSESITVAKIALIGTLLTALITAAATVFPVLIKDEPPRAGGEVLPGGESSTPTTRDDRAAPPVSPDGIQIKFFSPQADALISAGDDVAVAGTVTGLGSNTLWILAWHEDGESFFLIPGAAGVSAATTKNGPWSVTDQHVGDPSDKGKTIVYTAVQANAECDKTLSAMQDKDSVRGMPQGCTILPGQRSVRIK